MSSVRGGPGQPINSEQYQAGLDAIVDACRIVLLIPLDELREFHAHAETLGPMLDPTMYMRGGRDNLDDQRDLLDAAEAVQAAGRRIKARLDRRTGVAK